MLQGVGDALVPGFHHAPHTTEALERGVAIVDESLGTDRGATLRADGMTRSDADAVAYAKAAIARYLIELAA